MNYINSYEKKELKVFFRKTITLLITIALFSSWKVGVLMFPDNPLARIGEKILF